MTGIKLGLTVGTGVGVGGIGVGVGVGMVLIVIFNSLLKQFETGQPPFGVGLNTINSFAFTPPT